MTTTDRVNENIVDVPQMRPVVASLKQALGDKLVAAVLFGSQARDEAGENSDWDLLIIANGLPKRTFPRHLHLKQLIPPLLRGKVALIAKTPAEFESYLSDIFLDIALDGLILYDTNGYMAERLAHLRQIIRDQGLRREQKGKDLLWRWEEFPGFDWSLEWKVTS